MIDLEEIPEVVFLSEYWPEKRFLTSRCGLMSRCVLWDVVGGTFLTPGREMHLNHGAAWTSNMARTHTIDPPENYPEMGSGL